MLISSMIEIKQSDVGKTIYCSKCKEYIAKIDRNGWLQFPFSVKVASDGEKFKVKCSCKEEIILKLNKL